MSPNQLVATTATGILVAGACLHAALAAGYPLGIFAWGGQYRVLPPLLRVGSAASIGALSAAAWLILAKSGLLSTSLSPIMLARGVWVCCGFLLLNTAGNFLSRSRSERAVMTPATLILAMCFAVVAYPGS